MAHLVQQHAWIVVQARTTFWGHCAAGHWRRALSGAAPRRLGLSQILMFVSFHKVIFFHAPKSLVASGASPFPDTQQTEQPQNLQRGSGILEPPATLPTGAIVLLRAGYLHQHVSCTLCYLTRCALGDPILPKSCFVTQL
jgi:hypothetical protein